MCNGYDGYISEKSTFITATIHLILRHAFNLKLKKFKITTIFLK